MIAVIQRVSEASVKIDENIKASIQSGFMILLGVSSDDNDEDIDWLSKKIISLRIFADQEGKMNLSIKEINGSILIISQFTLQASVKKGNRPSFTEAAKPEVAVPLYTKFIFACEEALGKPVQTGEFGADMKVSLINDGPVTIAIDSKNRK